MRFRPPRMNPGALAADAPEYQDAEARRFYRQTQLISKRKMQEFDALDPEVRDVERVVGHIGIARDLAAAGITTAAAAEPMVRQMLETGARPRGATMRVRR